MWDSAIAAPHSQSLCGCSKTFSYGEGISKVAGYHWHFPAFKHYALKQWSVRECVAIIINTQHKWLFSIATPTCFLNIAVSGRRSFERDRFCASTSTGGSWQVFSAIRLYASLLFTVLTTWFATKLARRITECWSGLQTAGSFCAWASPIVAQNSLRSQPLNIVLCILIDMEFELTNKYKNWVRNFALWAVILGVFIGAFYLNRSGNPELVMSGEITSCNSIFGGRGGTLRFANVTLENGTKVKIYYESCCKGKNIMVAKKRGVLFMNTIYMSKNA
ncbi:MAG: hypothetical protein R3E57_00565 [Porticoccaceae bacterium]